MKRPPDPDAGRYVVDCAYSMGCLHALGFPEAARIIKEVVETCKTEAAKRGLVEQFEMGLRHESAR